jgi:hypothetical protein
MEIDVQPTSVNMVEIEGQKQKPGAKLNSEGLKAIGPEVQVSVDEYRGTSHMLNGKLQVATRTEERRHISQHCSKLGTFVL